MHFELIFPNFEPSQVFELKSEPFQGKITWSIFRSEKLKGSNFEPSQSTCIYHHVKNLHRRLIVNESLSSLLSPSQDSPFKRKLYLHFVLRPTKLLMIWKALLIWNSFQLDFAEKETLIIVFQRVSTYWPDAPVFQGCNWKLNLMENA